MRAEGVVITTPGVGANVMRAEGVVITTPGEQ